jgi:hypothetical protein
VAGADIQGAASLLIFWDGLGTGKFFTHRPVRLMHARSGKLCAVDLQSDLKFGSISAYMSI